MASDKKKNFYKKYYADVVKATEGTGLFPEMVIAQMALESSWGESGLATKANNMFGVKSHGEEGGIVLQNKKEGKDKSWRKYDSPLESIKGYVSFLQDNPRYKKGGVLDAKTPQEQAELLQKAGYAGDSTTYADKIKVTLNNNENSSYVKEYNADPVKFSGNDNAKKSTQVSSTKPKTNQERLDKTLAEILDDESTSDTDKYRLQAEAKEKAKWADIADSNATDKAGGKGLYAKEDANKKLSPFDEAMKTADLGIATRNDDGSYKGGEEKKPNEDAPNIVDAAKAGLSGMNTGAFTKAKGEHDEKLRKEKAEKEGDKGTLITEGKNTGKYLKYDESGKAYLEDVNGVVEAWGGTDVPKDKAESSGGGSGGGSPVNIQDLDGGGLAGDSSTPGTVEEIDIEALQQQLKDNEELMWGLENQEEYNHIPAEFDKDIGGSIADIGRGIVGMVGANEKIPTYKRGDMFQTSMDELTNRRNMGLSSDEKGFAKQMAERGYGYDVKNIRKLAGGSSGVALGNLGRATGQLYDEYGKVAVRDEQVRRQNRTDFNRGALSDEQVNRQIFTDDLRQAEMTKQAGAGLVQDATKNIRDRNQYNKAYGEDSQFFKYQDETLRGLGESRVAMSNADKARTLQSGQEYRRQNRNLEQQIHDATGGLTKNMSIGGESPLIEEAGKSFDYDGDMKELQRLRDGNLISDDDYFKFSANLQKEADALTAEETKNSPWGR